MPPARLSIAQLLQQGQAFHQQGQWDRAAAHYREVLERQPRSFEALHLLGMLNLQTGNAAGAATLLTKAVKIKPTDAGTRTLLGVAMQSSGTGENALEHFEQAVKLEPRNPEFHYNLGKALRSLEKLEEAVACYRTVLLLSPENVSALNNLSEILNTLENAKEAADLAQTAIRLKPGSAEAWSNLGGAQLSLEQEQEALVSLDRALTLRPELPRALCNRAKALAKLHRFEEAYAAAERAVALYPTSHETVFTRGLVHLENGNTDSALTDFERALAIVPTYSPALLCLGTIRLNRGEHDLAIAALEKAIEFGPENAVAHYNLGIALLLTGRFERGWPEYQWRFRTREFGKSAMVISLPQWQDSIGVRLLVVAEQGIGDQIMYASMLHDLQEQADRASVTVAISDKLIPLLSRSFPNLHFISLLETVGRTADYDEYVSIGDLGLKFRNGLERFLANRRAFLTADPSRTVLLRQALHQSRTQVCGLSWYSNNKSVGSHKSMALADLSHAFEGLDFAWIDLQYGDTAAERAEVKKLGGISVDRVPSVDTFNDIDGLASLVDACDVIVTISNTTAHLAGALGKTVFLMLPYAQGRFWCWQADRSDALWYPNVRIFRQPKEGDWASVLAEVRDALAALPPPSKSGN